MFREYIEATKGKHRIGISRVLNQLYKVESKTDEELTNEIDIEDILLSFEREVWRIINLNDLQPFLIDIASETNKKDAQNDILELLNEFDSFETIEVLTDQFKHPLIKKSLHK